MALIQRYTTELSTHASSTRQSQDDTQAIEHVLQDVAAIKRQDEDEKRYLHSLNDRLEELIRSLDELELANKQLRDDLNSLISSWGIAGENRARFLQELDEIIHRLSEQNRRKIIFQAEAKIFDEQTQVTDRVSVVFIDIINLYRDKCQIIFDLTNELEEELRKIRLRLDISNAQVKSHDDDYQKELAKFRSYLTEWSQLALDKQYLLNDIQSLRERYNLRLAYNQEEINEWQRLLNRISQESKNYYRDYLETIKQQIQMDYEQMAKDQQMEIEIQLKSRLKEIQEKIHLGLPLDENDERRRREETQRFESRLDQSTIDYDRLQNDYRILAEEIQHKRRALQDLQNELRNKARKHAEQHARQEHETDATRVEYYTLKDELDKLAYQLRFSVEEELKIYEALLNSLHRKKDERLPIDDSKYRQTTTTRYLDTISSGEESTGFRWSQPTSSETTRIFTTQTNTDDAIKYRPPPPPLLTESTRIFTTERNIDDGIKYRPPPLLTESTRIFTTEINTDDAIKYRPPPLSTETTRIFTTERNIDDAIKYRPPPPPLLTESTRIFTTERNIDDGIKYRPPPLLTESTRIFTTERNIDDAIKYRPPPPPLLTESSTTTTKTIKQSDNTIPIIRIDQAEQPSNQWTYETITSGTASSTRDESTDRDRSTERTIVPTRTDTDRYGGIQQSLLDQNRTTTTTTRTTRRFGHENTAQQQQQQQQTAITSNVPEVDEKFLQSKIHITRKYKGNILIKFVDVSGRFVEIENTGNQARDLTGWYIERTVDGNRLDFTFPGYELAPHTTVRIYGNYHRRSPSTSDDHHLQLIAPNFYDWGNGREMRTELFNRDDVGKALFEQTIRD